MYAERDVARLQAITRALELGFRAGDVVPLPVAELERLLKSSARDLDNPENVLPPDLHDRIMRAVLGDNIHELHALLRRATKVMGPKRFVTEVAHPLCVRVGDMWEAGQLAVRQEHVVSEALTTQLRILLNDLAAPSRRSPVVLLATFPGEPHSLPLDLVGVYVAAAGLDVRIIGADTPPKELAAAASAMQASVVGVSVSKLPEQRVVSRQLRELNDHLDSDVYIWIGGAGARDTPGKNVRLATSWALLDRAIGEVEEAA